MLRCAAAHHSPFASQASLVLFAGLRSLTKRCTSSQPHCSPLPFWTSWVLFQGLLAALEACLLVGFGYAFGFRLVSIAGSCRPMPAAAAGLNCRLCSVRGRAPLPGRAAALKPRCPPASRPASPAAFPAPPSTRPAPPCRPPCPSLPPALPLLPPPPAPPCPSRSSHATPLGCPSSSSCWCPWP